MTSNTLFISNCAKLLGHESSDTNRWGEIYNMIKINTSLVDRSMQTVMPYNIKVYPGFEMITDLSGFSKTYEECCADRVKELIAKADKLQVPIGLLYSGGIDSTMVLVSFMKALTPAELKSKVVVLLNHDSINENPNFYYNFIRKSCTIKTSDTMSSLFDGKYLIVGGEHNDQLFGSDLIGGLLNRDPSFDFTKPYTRELILSYFRMFGMKSEEGMNTWFDIIEYTAKKSPCEIKTVFDFFWWLNFTFKWQSVFFRILLRVDKHLRKNITFEFIDNYYHHFFSSHDFQKWSMLNPELKIKTKWNTYKYHAKDLIFEFNKDAEYRDHKLKCGSLSRLFLQKEMPLAMTDQLEYVYDLDPALFYQPNNSFNTTTK